MPIPNERLQDLAHYGLGSMLVSPRHATLSFGSPAWKMAKKIQWPSLRISSQNKNEEIIQQINKASQKKERIRKGETILTAIKRIYLERWRMSGGISIIATSRPRTVSAYLFS